MNNCLNCEGKTTNPKFCSRSCAATYNNRIKPKRAKTHNCIDCGKPITAERKRCREHFLLWVKSKEVKDMSLKEAIYENHHRSSAFALVRSRARAIAKKLGLNTCVKCGYDKHVEIAHIKPISSFSEEVLISVINSKENLMSLCPNCHWEYDHNI